MQRHNQYVVPDAAGKTQIVRLSSEDLLIASFGTGRGVPREHPKKKNIPDTQHRPVPRKSQPSPEI